jgi:RNA polymerase sigma-70 factor (ECF subfamily)
MGRNFLDMRGEDVPKALESLMVRYQQSDSAAAGELIEQLSPQFFQFYLGNVRDRDRAEDLLQDFWLRIHLARRTYRPGEPVLPWMYAIARRVRIDRYRRTRRAMEHEVNVEILPEPPAPAPPREAGRSIGEMLEVLPESQREVVLMLKVSGLSLEEVARATRCTVGSVKQKSHRAYEKLRTILEQRSPGDAA